MEIGKSVPQRSQRATVKHLAACHGCKGVLTTLGRASWPMGGGLQAIPIKDKYPCGDRGLKGKGSREDGVGLYEPDANLWLCDPKGSGGRTLERCQGSCKTSR